ncbi:hypothetical protein AB0M28_32655 [Streptomyces sp. NPDC051940]|uniref:hypothetical protein n=1 Tax=Streptomyces sp. NPDC051940 TaxID=3155675 RepID=UPI0034450E60
MRFALRLLTCTVITVLTAGTVTVALGAPDDDRAEPSKGPTEAACGTLVEGSTARVTCFNPSPYADRIRLHVECADWWDPDVDTGALDLDPAEGGRLQAHCWFDVAEAWVTHERG